MVELNPIENSPCKMPNGLQWTEEGLFVMDQYTDNVYVVGEDGTILRTIETPTENGSGITVGGGYLWTASNGLTTSRSFRSTDTHLPYLYQLDLKNGKLINRIPTYDGSGIHGLEWDDGFIWITSFNPRAIILIDSFSFSVIKKFYVDLDVLHGLARDEDGIWCTDRLHKIIAKFDVDTGEELDRIEFSQDAPDPHGLSIKDGELWYSDAAFPDPSPLHQLPEIGRIKIVK